MQLATGLNLTLKTEMAGDHDAGLKTEMAGDAGLKTQADLAGTRSPAQAGSACVASGPVDLGRAKRLAI